MSTRINLEKTTIILPDKPKMFACIMHNDDYTTMDFVVMVLIKIFKKSEPEANEIMMVIHNSGQCTVSIYPFDIAATKKMQTEQLASEKGFPLRVTISEVSE